MQQKADPDLELAAVRSNAASVPGSAAGSGTLQWIVRGPPANSGHTSRTRSHRLITMSKRHSRNASRCFEERPPMSIPRAAMTRTAAG